MIPAHDEESGIAATVRSCLSLGYPESLFEVLVIADNCSDGTASVARRQGATVVKRQDPDKKSKGHAIKFLIDRLQESGQFAQLDAIVVIDADTTVSTDLLLAFAGSIEAGQDWIQCFYSVANPDTSWRTRLMAYAFCLFNGVTPLGQSVLGLSAGFKGNGMCFATRSLQRVPWRSFGLVEDMEYSWNVRIAGGKIAFLPEVRVLGVMLACRPGELVSMRPCEIDQSGPVWVYRPRLHKTMHRGKDRIIPIGPRARLLLAPWLPEDPDRFCFPSQRSAHITVDGYAQAIIVACKLAGIEPWTTNQIRHSGATRIRQQASLDAAQVILGHSNISMTETYAERNLDAALKIALEVG